VPRAAEMQQGDVPRVVTTCRRLGPGPDSHLMHSMLRHGPAGRTMGLERHGETRFNTVHGPRLEPDQLSRHGAAGPSGQRTDYTYARIIRLRLCTWMDMAPHP
jgi:hypothetical protein